MFRTGDIVNQHSVLRPNVIQVAQYIIRKITSSYYDHTGIILVESGKVFVVEAQFDCGVTKVPWEEWITEQPKDIIVYRRKKPVSDAIMSSMIKSQIGEKRYDYLALIQQIYYQLARRIKQNIDYNGYTKNGKATDKFYCSEFAAWCHDLDDWWKYVPGDFDNDESFEKIMVMQSK